MPSLSGRGGLRSDGNETDHHEFANLGDRRVFFALAKKSTLAHKYCNISEVEIIAI